MLLLCLALGRAPLAELDDATILRRKLELGTYAALARDDRLPPIIGDLVRGMLAEDPEHRPTPTLLLDPASARGRRVAARPPRRAPQDLVETRQAPVDIDVVGNKLFRQLQFSQSIVAPASIGIKNAEVQMSTLDLGIDADQLLQQREGLVATIHLHV